MWAQHVAESGQPRVELLEAYNSLGVSRVMAILRDVAVSNEALEAFVEDCRTAGVEMVG